ncbi:MAG: hypothetical protein LRY23_00185 [Burkholderiaceae bacterium]|nr:hypothetical protein [Burkholderiaceae bacterium]
MNSKFIDSCQHLSNLISLGLALMILNYNAWVTGPWHAKHQVTTTPLSRLTKIQFADVPQIRKANISRFSSHLRQNFYSSVVQYSITININVKGVAMLRTKRLNAPASSLYAAIGAEMIATNCEPRESRRRLLF